MFLETFVLHDALGTYVCPQIQCLILSVSVQGAMSSDSDTPMGMRSIVANRQAETPSFDGNWLAGNKGVVTIHGHTCSLFPDFRIEANICTGTEDGTTYTGTLQGDGLGIVWSDGDTWTLMVADRADEVVSHSATESANSDDSIKRPRKDSEPVRHRHRRRRHHRSRTRRENTLTTGEERIVDTRKKTNRNTVTLTNSSTWRPQSPSPAHTKISLTKYNRKHPAGAPPNPPARSLRNITIAQPTSSSKRTYISSGDKEKQKEAAFDPESHFVAVQQTSGGSNTPTEQNIPLSQ